MDEVILRTTFIVGNMEDAIRFYRDVFGWTIAYDNVVDVHWAFPPAAPDGAKSRLVIFQAEDPDIGGLGFMQYLNDPIPEGPSKHRGKLNQGDAILVIRTYDPDVIYERVKKTGAVVVSPPIDWEVPGYISGTKIKLRTMSLFDPNGIYMEISLRYPDVNDGPDADNAPDVA